MEPDGLVMTQNLPPLQWDLGGVGSAVCLLRQLHDEPAVNFTVVHTAVEAQTAVDQWVQRHTDDLIAIRRDLHAHPEVGREEYRTTKQIVEFLSGLGLEPTVLAGGTGVLCDLGGGSGKRGVVALRADIDALPILDSKTVAYKSLNVGTCHACGHDVHTTALLGAAAALASVGRLPGRIRLIFQPAEELIPGGALQVLDSGALDPVSRVFALHCDPRLDLGKIGLRVGPITAACDTVSVQLHGPGGHTARPHLTADLVNALGKVIVETPALLSRRVDPRAGLLLVWGAVSAGVAGNAIPQSGSVRGTVRVLSRDAWVDVGTKVRDAIAAAVAGTGVTAEVDYERGVPPVVNEVGAYDVQHRAAMATVGAEGITTTEQSMGGEDFGWLTGERDGALARLGVRTPTPDAPTHELHQGSFDIDERALAIAARFVAHTALEAFTEDGDRS